MTKLMTNDIGCSICGDVDRSQIDYGLRSIKDWLILDQDFIDKTVKSYVERYAQEFPTKLFCESCYYRLKQMFRN